MIKYKLKKNCINMNSKTPIEDYLKSFGITKISSFLQKPAKEDELNPFLLCNMELAIKELHKGFTQGKKFFLQVDSDVDGFTSASIFYSFFKKVYPNANIVFRLQDGKEHGVILDTVPEDTDYIILPDSGSMQIKEQEALTKQGKVVIILDHHHVDEFFISPQVIIVNNQISDNFSNKFLSGAGVTFKTIQAYDSTYNCNGISSNYYDLAALGIISDMMNITDLDNNFIIYQGLNNIKNLMLKALLNKQKYSISNVECPNKIDIAFYISPIINGVIREGTQEEKNNLFKGFIEDSTDETYTRTYRGEEKTEDFYTYVARTSYNIKERQNTKKEKAMEFLKTKIEQNNLNENKILVVIASKEDKVETPQNITGLVAMELLNNYNKPTLVLRPKIEEGILCYSGSGRSKKYEGFESFLDFIQTSKYTRYGAGHDMAFGTSIKAEDLDNFIQECNERLQNVAIGDDFVEVDAIFTPQNINNELLEEFAKYKHLYGMGLPEPTIVIEGMYNPTMVRLMMNNSIKIRTGNIDCVALQNKKLYEIFANNSRGFFTFVGKPELNEFLGRVTIQLKISKFEVKPIILKSLF